MPKYCCKLSAPSRCPFPSSGGGMVSEWGLQAKPGLTERPEREQYLLPHHLFPFPPC